MKKHTMKVLGLSLAASMVVQAGAYAFGGTYPEHSTAASSFKYENSSKAEWSPSDENYLFTVEGKTFILLDTDSEGNYFVMADNSYGKYPYSTEYDQAPVLETKTVTADGTTFEENEYVSQMDPSKWMFSTTNTTSIGYWLNNDFLNNGNGSKALPQSIKDNLVEKTWTVEGINAIVDWTANDFYDKERATAAAERCTLDNGYDVTGKISLMSYTEYKKYQDIIGWVDQESNWDGFMLRTPGVMLTAEVGNASNDKLMYKYGSIQVKNNSLKENANPDNKMIIHVNDTPNKPNFHVRPVMWLNKDFFKNVACDVDSIGSIPKDEILKNTDEDLLKIYSAADLSKLKNEEKSWDWGHYPEHPSEYSVLQRVSNTKVNDVQQGPSPAENLFTVDGRTFILLDRDNSGNYFVMADEVYGNYFALTQSYIDSQDPDTKNWTPDVWNFNPAQADSLAFRLNDTTWGFMGQNPFGYAQGFNGDQTTKTIPESMRDDLVEYDWEIEPAYADYSWPVQNVEYPYNAENLPENIREEIVNWRDNTLKPNSKKTTVKAKVATMSYTEYETYKSKIGFQYYDPSNSWIGYILRTPIAYVNGTIGANNQTESWTVEPGYLTINLSGSSDLTYSNAIANKTYQYMVRPVMWLNKDFFKNNKIDVATAGSTVRAEMRDLYTPEDLEGTYTTEEINTLLGIQEVPALSDVKVTNNGADVTDIGTVTEATVSAKVSKTGGEETAVLIAAVYDENNSLIAVNFDTVDFGEETTVDASTTVSGFENAALLKVMLWSGSDTMKPLCNAVQFQ